MAWRSTSPPRRSSSSGDVIVAAAGQAVATVDAAARADRARSAPGDDRPPRPAARTARSLERTVKTVAPPTSRERRDHRDPRRPGREDRAAAEGDIDLGNVGGPSGGPPVRAPGLPGARQRRRPRPPGRRDRRDRARRHDRVGRRDQAEDRRRHARRGRTSSSSRLGKTQPTARRYAGGLRIIPVESFEQALRVLETLPREIAFSRDFASEGRHPQFAGFSSPEGSCGARRSRPQCPLSIRGIRTGDRGDMSKRRRRDMRGLLLPPRGALRPSREHAVPDVPRRHGAASRRPPSRASCSARLSPRSPTHAGA